MAAFEIRTGFYLYLYLQEIFGAKKNFAIGEHARPLFVTTAIGDLPLV